MEKVAIVTGSNQGLGLALVRGLCRALGPGATVYLTARDEARGRAAQEALARDKLSPEFLLLDVTDDASVRAAAEAIRARHGGVDIVISNAAARIVKDVPQAEQVAQFIDTNNHGTFRLLRKFAPLLRESARVLVIASSFGSLRNLDASLHARFDVDKCTLEEIEQAMDNYAASVQAGRAAAERWPDWINIASKVGQVASAKIFARMMGRGRDVLINAACPGLVDTDASRPWFDDMSQAQSPDAAAADIIWLATLPPGTDAPYGELVRHRKCVPWN